MNAYQIVIDLEAVGIKLWLTKFSDGRLAIAYDNAEKIKSFKKVIASHRDDVIALLKRRLPVPRQKIHSAIALEHALQWLVEMPDDVDCPAPAGPPRQGRDSKQLARDSVPGLAKRTKRRFREAELVSAPSACRWLTGWLTPAKQWSWQLSTEGGDDGKLPWSDWKEVVNRVESEHERVCENVYATTKRRLK